MKISKIYTLVFVRNIKDKQILLGLKKRGYGKDKWNGLGGKVETGETILDGAKRETKEESGADVQDLKKVGLINFQTHSKMNEIQQVHVFCADQYTGQIQETEEMIPQWFNYDQIPYKKMYPDFEIWLPTVLDNKLFKSYFLFTDDEEKILDHKLEILQNI